MNKLIYYTFWKTRFVIKFEILKLEIVFLLRIKRLLKCVFILFTIIDTRFSPTFAKVEKLIIWKKTKSLRFDKKW